MKRLFLVFVLFITTACNTNAPRAIPRQPQESVTGPDTQAPSREPVVGVDVSAPSFKLFVYYIHTDELLREAGFDFVAPQIMSQRNSIWTAWGPDPIIWDGVMKQFKLVRFTNLPTDGVNHRTQISALGRAGCGRQMANFWDLLALAKANPEAQRQARIAELGTYWGSIVRGEREMIPYLYGDARNRTLNLWDDADGWKPDTDWRFLAICTN